MITKRRNRLDIFCVIGILSVCLLAAGCAHQGQGGPQPSQADKAKLLTSMQADVKNPNLPPQVKASIQKQLSH